MFKNYSILLAIGIIWGSQFIFQELSLASFHPVWIGAFRATLGACTLGLICKISGLKGSNPQWLLFTVIALLEAVIPFVLIPWAQQELSSSITAIMMGTLPLYTLLLAPIFIKGATISQGNLASIMIGFSGLLILFYPDISLGLGEINIMSVLAILLATACFATALLLLNRVRSEHPLIVARNVLSMATIQLLVIAFLTTPLDGTQPTTSSLLSLVYLGVMCAGVVYYLYMLSVKNAGAVFTSMTNYLVPTVGVFIGVLISGEAVKNTTWLALAIILLALLFNQVLENKSDRINPQPDET